jgi:hypothetical protein
LVETSEQELSKASGAFVLTENGFDDLPAQSGSPGAFELEGHSGGAKREPGFSRHHVSSREAKDLL